MLLEPSSLTRYLKAYERHLGPHGSNGDRPSLRNRIASYIDGLEQWILDPADGPGPLPDTDQT